MKWEEIKEYKILKFIFWIMYISQTKINNKIYFIFVIEWLIKKIKEKDIKKSNIIELKKFIEIIETNINEMNKDKSEEIYELVNKNNKKEFERKIKYNNIWNNQKIINKT